MAKKFYAVRCGRNTGIYKTWDECRKQVTGFKGAAFKGFETLEEANAFLAGAAYGIDPRPDAAAAYVDGSFDIKTRRFSYGMIILYNDTEITRNEAFDNSELAEMRNVAGEIQGAKEAMLYCVSNNIKKLDLYYDYAGIECWCTGAWKTTKPGTIAYKEYYDWISKQLDVRFVKVKGHSGDKYNEMADSLAKKALGLSR